MLLFQIFVINLQRRPKRRARMLACGDALHLNMTIFDAVDGRYVSQLVNCGGRHRMAASLESSGVSFVAFCSLSPQDTEPEFCERAGHQVPPWLEGPLWRAIHDFRRSGMLSQSLQHLAEGEGEGSILANKRVLSCVYVCVWCVCVCVRVYVCRCWRAVSRRC